MARESWIALRADVRRDLSEVLRYYGFSVLDQSESENTGNPFSVEWRQHPLEGTVPFYVFFDGGWTLIYDPWFILWEEQSVHARLSRRFDTPVVVFVARSPGDSLGYGWFEAGVRKRWFFRSGDVITQDIGAADEWEHNGALAGGDPGETMRRAWGIHLDASPEVICLYTSLPGHRPRKRLLQWLPWPRRSEKGTPTW